MATLLAPENLTAAAASATAINLAWTDCSEPPYAEENRFDIRYSTDPQISQNVQNSTAVKDAVSKQVTGLSPTTTYYFKVRAHAFANSGNLHSPWSPVASATTQQSAATKPDAPTGVTVVGTSSNTVKVEWTHPGTNALGFHVDWSIDNSTWQTAPLIVPGTSVRAASVSGLQHDTTYYVRVRGYGTTAVGAGDWSTVATGRTKPFDPRVVPNPPTNLDASVSGRTVTLTWTDNSTNEQAFGAFVSLAQFGEYQLITHSSAHGPAIPGTGSTGTMVLDGLFPVGIEFFLHMKALGEGGRWSPPSNAVSVTLSSLTIHKWKNMTVTIGSLGVGIIHGYGGQAGGTIFTATSPFVVLSAYLYSSDPTDGPRPVLQVDNETVARVAASSTEPTNIEGLIFGEKDAVVSLLEEGTGAATIEWHITVAFL